MKCNKAKILISAELDGELTPREELALTLHLGKCEACAKEKASVSSLRGVMAAWGDEEPSELLAQRFAYKLQDLVASSPQVGRPVRKRSGYFGTALTGMAAVAVVAVMLIVNQGRVPESVPLQAPITAKVTQPVKQVQPVVEPKIVANADVQPVVRHIRRVHKHTSMVAMKPAPAPTKTPVVPGVGELTIAAPPASIPGTMDSAIGSEERVKDNIGEAGLAMNENVEKLRGKLQEAVDLLTSKPPLPAGTDTDVNGVNQP